MSAPCADDLTVWLTSVANVALSFRCSSVLMTSQTLFPFDSSDFEAVASKAVIAMSEELARTMCVARALVEHGRTVDLAGLDRGVGLLCAKALDLSPPAGREVRSYLVTVLVEVDRLTEALRTHAQV